MLGLRRLRSNTMFQALVVVAALATLNACGRGEPEAVRLAGHVGTSADPVWADGGFESGNSGAGTPVGWTATNVLNAGLAGFSPPYPPPTWTSLPTSAGGWLQSPALGPNTTYSVPDNDLGAGQAFRWPRFGNYAAVVNYNGTGVGENGDNKSLNFLQQSMTIGLEDIDPADGQLHVRFAYAPVLEYPSHVYLDQPYYQVTLTNTSQGNTILYDAFSVSGGQGVPWNSTRGVNTHYSTQWVNWALADITPQQGSYTMGDTVLLTVVASGCALGGHFGRVYVDGVGMQVPGPFVSATGPTQAAVNSNITYDIHYGNGASTTQTGALITITTPQNTNYIAGSITGFADPNACTVGGSNTNPLYPSNPTYTTTGPVLISCPISAMGPSSYGNFSFSLQVGAQSTGTLTFANYGISAIGYPQLLGSQVNTLVSNIGDYADVAVTYPNPLASVNWNQNITFAVTVTNHGGALPAGAVNVVYPQAANFSAMTWSCATVSNATCVNNGGTGTLSEFPLLGASGSVTYTINATVQAGSGSGYTSSAFSAKVVSTAVDPVPTNNSQTIGFTIGAPTTLTVNANNGIAGVVTSTPAGIVLSGGNAWATGNFAANSNVQLNANPIPGATFTGWGGGICSGTSPTCTVNMAVPVTVTATFASAPTPGAAAAVYAVQGSGQYAQLGNTFSTPLWALVTDANGTPVSSGTPVTFAASNPNDAAFSPSATVTTNQAGIAIVTVTAQGNVTASAYTVKATVAGNANASFLLTNVGPPTAISFLQGGGGVVGGVTDVQSADVNSTFAIPLVAAVTDVNGNPVPNANVTFRNNQATASSITQVPVGVVSDGLGHVTLFATANGTVTPGTGGNQNYTIQAILPNNANTLFYLQNNTGTPAYINMTQGSPQAALASTGSTPSTTTQFGQYLTVAVSDTNGGVVGGATVTFTAVAGSGGASGFVGNYNTTAVTAVTNIYGYASVAAYAGQGYGSWTVTATTSNGKTLPSPFQLTNQGTQFLNIVSGAPQSTVVGTAFPTTFSVKLTNAAGLPIPGETVMFSVPTSGATATLSANSNITDANGLASVTGNANLTQGTYALVASNANCTFPQTFTLSNTSGPPVVTLGGSGQSATVNTAFANPLTLRMVDAYGNPWTGALVTFTIVNPNTTTTAVFTTPNNPNDPNIYITAVAANGNAQVNVTAGLLASFASTNPNYPIVAATSSGSYTFTLSNNAGVVSQIVVEPNNTVNSPIYANPNNNFISPLTVWAEDQYGNPLSSVAVTFTEVNGSTGAGCTFINNSNNYAATTGPAGSANANVTTAAYSNSKGGAFTVNVKSGGVTDTIYLYNLPSPGSGPSAAWNLPTGTVNAVAAGNSLGLTVTVLDANNAPAPNVTVTFTVNQNTTTNAGASFAGGATVGTAVTNSSGVATPALNANGVLGSQYSVSAAVPGIPTFVSSVPFVNTTGPAATLALQTAANQNTTVGTAFSGGLQVKVTDAYNNPVVGQAVTFTPNAGPTAATISIGNTTSYGAAYTSTTSATGLAPSSVASGNANTVAGTYTVTVATGTLTAKYTFTNNVGSASKVIAQGGTPQSGNVPVTYAPLVGQVTDLYGNAIANANVTLTPVGTGGATIGLSPTTLVTSGTGYFFSNNPNSNTVAGQVVVTASTPGASSATFTFTNLAGSPNGLFLVGTPPSSATVATSFSPAIQVELEDQYGNPVSGGNVVFSAPATGATAVFNPNVVATGANGVASPSIAAGNVVGNYNITITYGPGPYTLVLNVNNTAGPATSIITTSGTPQNANLNAAFATALGVHVTDNYNNVIAGAPVTFTTYPSAAGAGATLSASSQNTDVNGNANVTANANTVAGTFIVSASTLNGATSLPMNANFVLTNLAGTPNRLVAANNPNGNGQSAMVGTAFANPLIVQVLDAFGNPVANANVYYTTSASTAVINPNAVQTNGSGGVSVTPVAGTQVGTYSVVATSDNGASITFTLSNTAGSPNSIVVISGGGTNGSPPQTAVVQDPFTQPLVAEVLDAYGNPVPNTQVVFSGPSSGASASLSASSAVTNSDGEVSVRATALTVAGNFNVIATLPVSGNPNVDFALVTLPGPAVALVQDPNDSPGQTASLNSNFVFPLGLTVEDVFGNPISNANIDFVAPSTGPSAFLSATQGANSNSLTVEVTSDGNGHVQVYATANGVAGDYPVTANLDGNTTPVVSFPLTNSAAVLTVVATSSPSLVQSANVNTAFTYPLSVQILDPNGNAVAGKVVHFTAPASGVSAVLSANSNITDATGTAQVLATADNLVGTYDVVASVLGGTGPVTFVLTNTPGAAAAVVATPGASPQRTLVNTQFAAPLSVTVLDANGNGVPNVVVNWAAPLSGATAILSSYTTDTDAHGHTSVVANANATAGGYNVTATVTGLTPATFTLVNSTTPGVSLSLGVGDGGQSTVVDTNFTTPLAFTVLDANGRGVQNANVILTAPGSGASVTFNPNNGSVATDANGLQSFIATANSVAGSYGVVATVYDSSGNLIGSLPFVFSLTNTAGPAFSLAASLGGGTPPAQSARVHHFFPLPLTAYVIDAYGNPVAQETVTFSNPTSGPTCSLSSTTVTSDATGRVQVVAVAGGVPGSYDVTASFELSGAFTTFALTNAVDPPNSIQVVSGGQQTKYAMQASDPMLFVVYDASEYVATGVNVTFSTPNAGLSLNQTSAQTDGEGRVSVVATASGVGNFIVNAVPDNASNNANAYLSATLIPTTTALTDSNSTAILGVPFELKATVTAPVGGTPAGVVQFTADGQVIGQGSVDSNGLAVMSTHPPSLGQHSIGAHFLPNSGSVYQASEAQESLIVIYVGWHAVGNNCAQGSAQAFVLVLLGVATLMWRAQRRRLSF